MNIFKILLVLSILFFTNIKFVSAHSPTISMDQSNIDQIEQEPVLIPDNSLPAMPALIQNVFEQAPFNPDVSATADPGSDPNAPVDAQMWLLLLIVASFGIYLNKKSVSKI
jgi:hypothetical protein